MLKYGVLLNEGQAEVVEFVKARLRQLLMTKNVRHDIIDAVVSAEQADLSNLFASANILKAVLKIKILNHQWKP